MHDYAEQLRYANETIAHIERAQRQERRLQRAYRRMMDKHEAIDLKATGSKFAPPEWVKPITKFDDELYFFIVELRQVLRGREVMKHLGFDMPEVRQAGLVEAWRNVAEHWDDPPKGTPIRAMEHWLTESDDDEPGLSYSGDNKLREVSGLRLKRVRKDLRALRAAVGEVSEREWLHCYITPAEAAEILAISTDDLAAMEHPPKHLDFEDEGGVRYWREAVEARKEGWLLPPRWTS